MRFIGHITHLTGIITHLKSVKTRNKGKIKRILRHNNAIKGILTLSKGVNTLLDLNRAHQIDSELCNF